MPGVLWKNPGGGGSIYENIWCVPTSSSTRHPTLQVINMGVHCAHIEDPGVITYRIFYRDVTDVSQERIIINVVIPTLGSSTKICWYEIHLGIHWEVSKKSCGHKSNVGSLITIIIADSMWGGSIVVGPCDSNRAAG